MERRRRFGVSQDLAAVSSLNGDQSQILSGSPRSTECLHPFQAARVSAETRVNHGVRAGVSEID
jgi:hypothetical protein